MSPDLGCQLATIVNTNLVDTQTPVQNVISSTNKVSDLTTITIHKPHKVLTGLYNLRSHKWTSIPRKYYLSESTRH